MNGHVNDWLEAYYDGESHGRRLQQVKTHLAQCAACRTELEQLRALGALLRASPAAEGLTPPERFVAQVGLRLPRRQEQPGWQRTLGVGWRLAPLGLLGAWACVQAVLAVAGVMLIVLHTGLGRDMATRLLPAAQQGLWLTEVFGLSGVDLNAMFRIAQHLLSNGGPLGWATMLNLGALVVIGLLYWGWLASWWARRQHRPSLLSASASLE